MLEALWAAQEADSCSNTEPMGFPQGRPARHHSRQTVRCPVRFPGKYIQA
ncbi:MAG: hypothetical protein K5657_01080 [Desulfovibrio sp.]|nr:hypothetical protein [Desulfovibrio sp.]